MSFFVITCLSLFFRFVMKTVSTHELCELYVYAKKNQSIYKSAVNNFFFFYSLFFYIYVYLSLSLVLLLLAEKNNIHTRKTRYQSLLIFSSHYYRAMHRFLNQRFIPLIDSEISSRIQYCITLILFLYFAIVEAIRRTLRSSVTISLLVKKSIERILLIPKTNRQIKDERKKTNVIFMKCHITMSSFC